MLFFQNLLSFVLFVVQKLMKDERIKRTQLKDIPTREELLPRMEGAGVKLLTTTTVERTGRVIGLRPL